MLTDKYNNSCQNNSSKIYDLYFFHMNYMIKSAASNTKSLSINLDIVNGQ
jgi:hypothetical protein